MENAFEILKGRWKIIMRMIDVSLRHIAYIVVTCNMLHIMCTINKNKLDKEWIDKVKREL